jgi:hypothetical protein
MIYLLISGAPSVGKSQTIHRLTQTLLLNRFNIVVGALPPQIPPDFCIVLEGFDNTGKSIRILINSATDTPAIIQNLKDFYDNNLPIDFIISSVRDILPERDDFLRIMNIQETDTIIEIPLAKITRRNTWQIALNWYQATIDNLIIHTLTNPPFHIL